MREDEFIFDGFNSRDDMGLYVAHVNKPIAPSISNSRQPIPGAYGDINLGNAYGNKVFTITIQFLAPSAEDYNDAVHNLANFLIRDTRDGSEYSLIFGDDPNVEYYGIFTQIPEATQIQESVNDAKFDLQFTCSDPKGYLPQQDITVDSEPFVFTPDGTGEAYPIWYITPHADIPEIAIANSTDSGDGQYIDIGNAIDPSEMDKVVDTTPVVASDPCNTMATWVKVTVPPFSMSDNVTSSNMVSHEQSISIGTTSAGLYDYGDAQKYTTYFGPMIMHEDLTDYLGNFNLKFRMHHKKSYSRAISKAEVYLVGPSQERVGRIYVEDAGQGASSTLNIFMGKEGHETQFCHHMRFGPYINKKNIKVPIVTHGNKHTVVTGKTAKSKGKTEVVYSKKTLELEDKQDKDYFNDACLEFRIQKVGLAVTITVIEFDVNTGKNLSTKILNNVKKTLSTDGDFALRTIAFYAAKWPISEDRLDPSTNKVIKTYNYGYNSIINYEVEAVLDTGSTDADGFAKIIAHKGDLIIINSETHEVVLATNGGNKSLAKNVSFGSSFPSLQGGIEQTIGISPNIPDADVKMTYRPTYK
ncbi:distal tail protein Dit [Pediococcus claussenii]|uniref:distal tail protein Dit n=1 Tax=Pediococcus claussenii TaxID=187452 RepID=UPI00081A37E5|nr:distal tail protein Dit [Pediococcus claussenii]ANZ70378.1 hypothetical protein AYR57_08640 [Pediococcus claussenii]ANZ72194.1 hypothetical protein AYR58_08640 [Pediococcus claussenii]